MLQINSMNMDFMIIPSFVSQVFSEKDMNILKQRKKIKSFVYIQYMYKEKAK